MANEHTLTQMQHKTIIIISIIHYKSIVNAVILSRTHTHSHSHNRCWHRYAFSWFCRTLARSHSPSPHCTHSHRSNARACKAQNRQNHNNRFDNNTRASCCDAYIAASMYINIQRKLILTAKHIIRGISCVVPGLSLGADMAFAHTHAHIFMEIVSRLNRQRRHQFILRRRRRFDVYRIVHANISCIADWLCKQHNFGTFSTIK